MPTPSAHPPRRPSALRGFTLVEMMTVVAVGAVIAGLAANAVVRMRDNGSYRDNLNDVVSNLRRLRAEAFGRAVPTVLVVDRTANTWVALADTDSNFSLATFDPANPAPGSDKVLATGRLPASMKFGLPIPGTTNIVLPRPYQTVPAGKVECTFCGGNPVRGAIVFQPNGTLSFAGFPTAVAGSFSLTHVPSGRHVTIAAIARTGAVTPFEDL